MTYNYLTWDNTEPVVVTLVGDATVAVNISNAGRSAPNKRDVAALGLVQDTESRVYLIPNILLNPAAEGYRIRRRAKITDSRGVVWFVVGVDLIEHETTWRCVCQGSEI